MKNINLSPKVKEYFIHALKGIGIGFVDGDLELIEY